MQYKETQIGWLMVGMMLFFIFLMPTLYLLELGNNPMPLKFTLIMVLLFVVVFLLFYKLTVSVNNDEIKISFGIGIIKKESKP